MIGRTLSHYRIVEKIGAGGMGEVYRARDQHLGRDVALKVLPAGTLSDEHARKRFRKEAQALSKLNHPNIATVHDFDTQNGVDFLVMELVEGVTLSDKLAGGPLPEKEISRLGGQVAEALEEAHEQGVVHRDLKPGNVMVTAKGQVKVLDFGLAKLVRPVTGTATTESFTETQGVAGTLPYMAPEQLQGEAVDARTDIYALGTVLYEMAAAQRPFPAKQATQLIAAILKDAPPAPSAVHSGVGAELERIILKCLVKEPENRYQSAKELAVDLRRLGAPEAPRVVAESRRRIGRPALALTAVLILAVLGVLGYFARQRFWPRATPPAGKVMLAVLPFDNLSADPEQEYFSDGMTEEMIAELGQLQPQRLGVIARTSAMHYKDTDKRIDQIGRELGVDYILEGSVRRAAGRVRITAQLIQVSDQTHLWAKSYEREFTDVFAIQSEVAGSIADSLALQLLPAEQARLADARPTNAEAHEAYLKGHYNLQKSTIEGNRAALEYFQQAIEIDPKFAPAYAGLAFTYRALEFRPGLAPKEVYPQARAAALKALELDDTLAEAHTALANVKLTYDWDWEDAKREFERALELNPSSADAHSGYSFYLSIVRRYDEAIAESKRALDLDPLSPRRYVSLGNMFRHARQYDQAAEQCRKVFEFDPDYAPAHFLLARVYEQTGKYKEALAQVEKLEAVTGEPFPPRRAYVYALMGRRAEALQILDKHKEEWARRAPGRIANIYAALGDWDQAFAWLEKSYEARETYIIQLNQSLFDPWRDDPRFQSLLRRMNFPE
jgi:serine/threonine-protein kinase